MAIPQNRAENNELGAPETLKRVPAAPRSAVDLQITDTQAYLQNLSKGGSVLSKLDRSAYFRYPQDAEALRALMREHVKLSERLSVQIIGVGNGEEPLSYLAALSSELPPETPLSDHIDLRLIEVRPRDEVQVRYGWGKVGKGGIGTAFLASDSPVPLVARKPPKEYAASFEYDAAVDEYRFRPDIQSTLERAMNDAERSHFATPVENDIAAHPEEQHHVIACNNVLQHLGAGGYPTPYRNAGLPPEQYARFAEVLRGIIRRVVPGGLLVMHTDGASMTDTKGRATKKATELLPEFASQFTEIASGIFRKNEEKGAEKREKAETTVPLTITDLPAFTGKTLQELGRRSMEKSLALTREKPEMEPWIYEWDHLPRELPLEQALQIRAEERIRQFQEGPENTQARFETQIRTCSQSLRNQGRAAARRIHALRAPEG